MAETLLRRSIPASRRRYVLDAPLADACDVLSLVESFGSSAVLREASETRRKHLITDRVRGQP